MKPLSVNSLSPRPFHVISHGFTVAALAIWSGCPEGVPFRRCTCSNATAFLAVRKSPIKAVYAKLEGVPKRRRLAVGILAKHCRRCCPVTHQ